MGDDDRSRSRRRTSDDAASDWESGIGGGFGNSFRDKSSHIDGWERSSRQKPFDPPYRPEDENSSNRAPVLQFTKATQDAFRILEQYLELYKAWQEIWPESESPAAALKGFIRVIERYEEPHRGYHNTEHLEEFLTHLRTYRHKFRSTWPAVLLAMFYHDAVYNAKPGDDEKASVKVMYKDLLEAGLSIGSDTLRAEEFILYTINHKVPKRDKAALIFIDADMAIVGSPTNRYARYVEGFYKEYGVHYTPKDLAAGRAGFLQGKLESGEPIFKTPEFSYLEEQARINMQTELVSTLKKLANPKAAGPYP